MSAAVPDGETFTIRIGDAPSGALFPSACFIGGILKERQVVQELKATTERQAAVIALQEGQIKTLIAGLKQQADQIQKVSAQLEMIRRRLEWSRTDKATDLTRIKKFQTAVA